MNCRYCNGTDTVEQEITTFSVCDIPEPFMVENVPALVCYACGDKTFSSSAIKAMNKIKYGEVKAHKSRPLRVFDFSKLENPSKSLSEKTI